MSCRLDIGSRRILPITRIENRTIVHRCHREGTWEVRFRRQERIKWSVDSGESEALVLRREEYALSPAGGFLCSARYPSSLIIDGGSEKQVGIHGAHVTKKVEEVCHG